MKMKNRARTLAGLLLCVLLLAPCLLSPVLAAPPDTCSLRLLYAPGERPMEGVTFRVYRVASVDTAHVSYHAEEAYDRYHVLNSDGTWLQRAAALANYVSRDQLPADAEATTDAEGLLSFPELRSGLYLITGSARMRDGAVYTPTPFLLSLPNTTDGYTWDYAVETHVKSTYYVPGPDTTQRHALKVWDDAGNEDARPESVTVELLRDGAVYASTVLSAANNWRCDWTDLPNDADWQVVEQDPGDHYEVAIQPDGVSYVITNTYVTDIDDDDPPLIDNPDDPDNPGDVEIDDPQTPLDGLPQTGLLWWPVPLLAMLGLVLIFLGCLRRRKGIPDEEE